MSRWQIVGFSAVLAAGLIAMACGQGTASSPTPIVQPTKPMPTVGGSNEATATPIPSLTTPTPAPINDADVIARAYSPPSLTYIWKTDFSKRAVPLNEVRYFGLGRVPIQDVGARQVVSIQDANEILADREPVIVVEANGEARAYPLSMLIFVSDELANDVLGGIPIAVTW